MRAWGSSQRYQEALKARFNSTWIDLVSAVNRAFSADFERTSNSWDAAPRLIVTKRICAKYMRRSAPSLFDHHWISRFISRDERLTKLIECAAFDFGARTLHQVQIRMQIVERDQAKSENLFRFDEVTNVTT